MKLIGSAPGSGTGPSSPGSSKTDTYTVGVGGQTVFATTNVIGSSYTLFEDGIISTRASSATGAQEVTTGTTVPQGVIVTILY